MVSKKFNRRELVFAGSVVSVKSVVEEFGTNGHLWEIIGKSISREKVIWFSLLELLISLRWSSWSWRLLLRLSMALPLLLLVDMSLGPVRLVYLHLVTWSLGISLSRHTRIIGCRVDCVPWILWIGPSVLVLRLARVTWCVWLSISLLKTGIHLALASLLKSLKQ